MLEREAPVVVVLLHHLHQPAELLFVTQTTPTITVAPQLAIVEVVKSSVDALVALILLARRWILLSNGVEVVHLQAN